MIGYYNKSLQIPHPPKKKNYAFRKFDISKPKMGPNVKQ